MSNNFATIHSIQTMGTLDGPGIRYVLFLQGCPFRCLFCHNPDTWNTIGNFSSTRDVEQNKVGFLNKKSVESLVEDVLKYQLFYKASNGGVTVSGGEPLLQIKFLKEFYKELKQYHIHTAIDTCGYVDITDDLKELLEYTDLFLLDIKHLDADKHKLLTGKPNDKVLNFLNFINNKKPIWIRQVLTPNWTMDDEYIDSLIKFLKNYNIEKVELLPYHEMGKEKYKKLGIPYRLKTRIPEKDEVNKIRELFIKNGFDTV